MNQVANLLAMSDDEFREVVDRDLRRGRGGQVAEDAQGDTLRSLRSDGEDPDVTALAERWLRVLYAMSRSVEGQLAARRADYNAAKARNMAAVIEARNRNDDAAILRLEQEFLDYKAKYESARASTLRFKTGLDETTIRARWVGRDSAIAFLEDKIRKHRDEVLADNEEVSDADEELWEAVVS